MLPNQLVLPLFGETGLMDASVGLMDTSIEPLESEVDVPIAGQGKLFDLPGQVPPDDRRRKPSPTQLGAAGHKIFTGHVLSEGLNLQESPDPGHAGDDCWVEGKWIQIKTTGRLSNGRLAFYAGKRGRFDRYVGIDYFAFVVVGIRDLHARIVVMDGGVVRNRWPGPAAYLQPEDFPRTPDLRFLMPEASVLEDGPDVVSERSVPLLIKKV